MSVMQVPEVVDCSSPALGPEAALAELLRLGSVDGVGPGHLAEPILECLTPMGALGAFVVMGDERGVQDSATAGVSSRIVPALGPLMGPRSTPFFVALHDGTESWISSRAVVAARYPRLAEILQAVGAESVAAVPLVADGVRVGAMGIPFGTPKPFNDTERLLIRGVAAMAAQALARSIRRDGAHHPAVALLDCIVDAVFVADLHSERLVYVNGAAVAISGLSRERLLDDGFHALLGHSTYPDGSPLDLDPWAKGPGLFDALYRRPDGQVRCVEVHVGDVDPWGRRISVVVDVTDRVIDAEQRVEWAMLRAVASERERLAKGLQDSAMQAVYATSMGLAALAQAVPDDQQRRVHDLIDDLDDIITQLRNTIFELGDD